MEIAKVSEEGQVIIPSEMGKAYGWEVWQELILTNTGKGILIQPKKPFVPTTLNEVAGCLKYKGSPKTLDDMEAAIGEGIKEQWHDFSRSECCSTSFDSR
ncbi:MAG: AbrB/MazE/SpoVT family DNA-binding domain-containing protein [Cyanobacteriota bacterium]|nr:AbrB/MazE/SpoVT family DNA-binding domain-containing protein [Cyanobacteriota bacterium]